MEKSKSLSRDRLTGIILFFILTALSVSGTFFHEPWFDEIQAYLIARDASFHDIFFVLPHYEGHPPLWHILLLPAKLGLSCRAALNLAQIVTFAGFAAMLELRSPFGWKMKIFLSLNYYILYQYSVISRPYALFMLILLITAEIYPQKDEKPIKYLLTMVLLCLCHSYGIAIAGGLAVTDISRRLCTEKSFAGLFRNTEKKLIIAYCLMLAAALAIIAEIFPASNARGTNHVSISSIIVSFVFCWTLIPSEALLTSMIRDDQGMSTAELSIPEIMICFIFSAVIWYALITVCRKRKILSSLLLPYLFTSFFMAVYSAPHHFGVFIALVLMILWMAQKKEPLSLSEITYKLEKREAFRKLSRVIPALFAILTAGINLSWSAHCFFKDITSPYDIGEQAAAWIKDNDLEDKYIISGWNEDTTRILTYGAVNINGFIGKNIFSNAANGHTYCSHIMTTDEEYDEDIEKMKAKGNPDVIFSSSVFIENELEELELTDKYTLCFLRKGDRVFKDQEIATYSVIYVRSDLADGIKKDIE